MWEIKAASLHKILWFFYASSGKKPNLSKISPFCKFLLTEWGKLCIMLKRSPHRRRRKSSTAENGEVLSPSAVE